VVNAIYAYSAYVLKALWPVHLASFYPYEGIVLTGWKFLLSCLFLATVSFFVWRERHHLYLPVGWCWFLGTLVPAIGLVQVGEQGMADRYAYIPLIGIFWMIVWGASDLAQAANVNVRWRAIPIALLLVVLSILTWRQIGFWDSSLDLWSHALQVTRDNFVAEDYTGVALLLQTYQTTQQHTSEEAMAHFQNAARIFPPDPIAHLNIGADFQEHGRLQEAIEEYEQVLHLTRNKHLLAKTLVNMATVSEQVHNYDAAKQNYLAALDVDPGNQRAFIGLGKVGMEERIEEFTVTVSHSPSPVAYLQLGELQQAAGEIQDARTSFQNALKLDPKSDEARAALDSLTQSSGH
jgi:tetratricopeptide (TPR) repeat protein